MDEQQSPEPRRTGRARERQMRRRERHVSTGEFPASGRRISRQLKPAGGFRLPPIDWRRLRPVIGAVAALVFMIVVILLVGMFKDDPVEPKPNGLWIGGEWTYTTHDSDEVSDFARHLRDHEIGSVYALVSELNIDGTWTGRPERENVFDEVRNEIDAFVRELKAQYPEVRIYGRLDFRADIGDENYRLDDERLQETVAIFSAHIVETLGFDGIMLNVEPVWNGDENFLNLLRGVRQSIGDEALLAVAVPPDWTPEVDDVPVPEVIASGTAWSQEYKQRVALIQIDEIVIHAYNSYLEDRDDYSDWVAHQVESFATAVHELGTSVRLMVGIPAYDELPPAHLTDVENIAASVNGILNGLSRAGEAANTVKGVALFAGWEMDNADWATFRNSWINRSSQ